MLPCIVRLVAITGISLSLALLWRQTALAQRWSLLRWWSVFFGVLSLNAGGPLLMPGAMGLWYGMRPPRLLRPPTAQAANGAQRGPTPRLILLQGLPRSGKSTYAARLRQDLAAVVIAYDAIRAERTGDAADQANKDVIVQTARDRARAALLAGTTVIVDGTHAKRDWVTGWDDLSHTLAVPLAIIRINCPLAEAMRRNALCARRVPTRVLVEMQRWLSAFDDQGLTIQIVVPDASA